MSAGWDDEIPTVITKCCREYIAPLGVRPGHRCVYCGEFPRYLRPDPDGPLIVRDTKTPK